MLLGEGFGEEKEHISGLFVPGVDDSRPSSPAEEHTGGRPGATPGTPYEGPVVTQPNRRPVELNRKEPETQTVLQRQNSSDDEVTFIEDDSMPTPAKAPAKVPAPRRSMGRSFGVEQPLAAPSRRVAPRQRTSSSQSAGGESHMPRPQTPQAKEEGGRAAEGVAPAPKVPLEAPVPVAAPAPVAEVPTSTPLAAAAPPVATTPKPAPMPEVAATTAAGAERTSASAKPAVASMAGAPGAAASAAAAASPPRGEVFGVDSEDEESESTGVRELW
ncbi:unnamed protein product [Durusdinium trenchii]